MGNYALINIIYRMLVTELKENIERSRRLLKEPAMVIKMWNFLFGTIKLIGDQILRTTVCNSGLNWNFVLNFRVDRGIEWMEL
jgi:hypothetical protein